MIIELTLTIHIQLPCRVGLVKSSLAIELAQHFLFSENEAIQPAVSEQPTAIHWRGETIQLTRSTETLDRVDAERMRTRRLLASLLYV